MAAIDPEKKAEYAKRYREKNKEVLRLKKAEYYKKNREKTLSRVLAYQESRKSQKSEYDKKRRFEKFVEIQENKKEHYMLNREKIREQQAEYRAKNIEKIRAADRVWREANREKIAEKARIHYQKNKTELASKNKQYRLVNKEKTRERRKAYQSFRLKNDLNYRIKRLHHNLVWSAFRSQKAAKSGRLIALLGCSIVKFREHLEALWEPWMNWGNYGRYSEKGPRTWQIDHIVPISHFDLRDIDQAKKAFNYKNCRPLCSKQNIIENDRPWLRLTACNRY